MAYKRFLPFSLDTRHTECSKGKKIVHSKNCAGCFHQPHLFYVHVWCLKWGGGVFSSLRKWVIILSIFFYGSCREKWNGETDRHMATGKVTISDGLLFSLPHTSICTSCKVTAQPQSFLQCFHNLSFYTRIILPLKLQCLEAGNLLNSVPGHFSLQQGLWGSLRSFI